MSAFGELLREIMPTWLSRSGKGVSGRKTPRSGGRPRQKAVLGESADDPRALSRQADAVWQECIDEDRHGEAFPEPVGGKPAAASGKRAMSGKRKTRSKSRKQAQPSRKQ